jgi:hypothetical protein
MHEKRTLSVQRFENALTRNDFFVDLTIYDIPVGLLEDFSEYIIKPACAGQVTEAIKNLMRNAVTEELLFVKTKKIVRDNNG